MAAPNQNSYYTKHFDLIRMSGPGLHDDAARATVLAIKTWVGLLKPRLVNLHADQNEFLRLTQAMSTSDVQHSFLVPLVDDTNAIFSSDINARRADLWISLTLVFTSIRDRHEHLRNDLLPRGYSDVYKDFNLGIREALKILMMFWKNING